QRETVPLRRQIVEKFGSPGEAGPVCGRERFERGQRLLVQLTRPGGRAQGNDARVVFYQFVCDRIDLRAERLPLLAGPPALRKGPILLDQLLIDQSVGERAQPVSVRIVVARAVLRCRGLGKKIYRAL